MTILTSGKEIFLIFYLGNQKFLLWTFLDYIFQVYRQYGAKKI